MRIMIWPLPTRLFHWGLVIFTLTAWILSEFEAALPYHAAFGYAVGALLAFRWIWGLIGPRYSRFSDWPLSYSSLRSFIRNPRNAPEYPGHNPAASWVMLLILLVGVLVVASGLATYGVQEGRGPLASWNLLFSDAMESFAETHEVLTTLWMALISVHISGVILDTLWHPKRRTLHSMIDGYKQLNQPREAIHVSKYNKVALLFVIGALIVPAIALLPGSSWTKSRYSPVNYEKEAPLFATECAACHTLYPPHFLPRNSWKRLMANLEDHFGDDASLDEDQRHDIERYLLAHSAESSTKEAAYYFRKSIAGSSTNHAIIAMSHTKYWKRKHQNIDREIFESDAIRSRTNCKACHGDIEQGLIEDQRIAIPKNRKGEP